MTAQALVEQFRARGVTLRPDGDLLRFRPKSALTPEDLALLRQRKPEILDYLRAQASPSPTEKVVCFCCHERRFWVSTHGVTVCAKCHPPPYPDMVVEWIDGDGAS